MRFRMIRQLAAAALLLVCASLLTAAELQFALRRAVYQTNESIPLAVLRSGAGPLAAGDLVVELADKQGSQARYTFAVPAAPGARTEFVNLNGRLLRPGQYTVAVTVDGARAELAFELCSHLRKSSFRTVNWGSNANDQQHRTQGEDSLGYNLVMQNQGRTGGTHTAGQMQGGVDWTSCCTMSGGHQMDLRMACDWSDPYVVAQGGTRRVMKDVFGNRTAGNAIGSHFYDEPGLTWWQDPVTDLTTPHMVPAQVRAYEAAFGEPPLRYNEVDPRNPDHLRRWLQWGVWKLGFMSAAWRDAAWATSYVRPDYIPFTQSQYGFSAFTDGYYFNVVESLPLVSGHGGYHDWGPGYWNPSWTLDAARARDRAKPCWYLPTWYGNTTSDQMRLEQYLSFATGIQGLMTPPPCDPAANPFRHPSFDGIVESNKLMLKLGPIFNTMEERVEPVAMLYSLSNLLHYQATQNMHAYYAHQMNHGKHLAIAYLAGKLHQRTFQYTVDEDVVDGTLAARHRVLLLVSVDYLAPEVQAGLADFIAGGGTVLLTPDSQVRVPGAKPLPVAPGLTVAEQAQVDAVTAKKAEIMDRATPFRAENKELNEQVKALAKVKSDAARAQEGELKTRIAANTAKVRDITEQAAQLDEEIASTTIGKLRGALKAATRFGAGLEPALSAAGIMADATSSEPGITVQHQGAGEVQYSFVLNATHDYQATGGTGAQLGMKSAETDLRLPISGAALYDAVHGGPATGFTQQADGWQAHLRFGPGQMRVYAQTARPIGSVQVAPPILHSDLTAAEQPIRLDLTAAVLATDGTILSGAIPLRIRVTDPLGGLRHEFYRATSQGVLRLSVPLAANDPAGNYTVSVTELLARQEGQATLRYTPPARCGALAGLTRRALLFDRDEDHIFRFFRTHQDLTIVLGDNPAYGAVAERIARYLLPWAVRTRTVKATEVQDGKLVTEDARPTIAGLNYGGKDWASKLERSPNLGFNLEGPAILIGTPEDNPLIKAAAGFFLPVTPTANGVPGAGRGLLAYQRDLLGARQESLTLIAYDQAGLNEAAGSLYEVMAGLRSLTPWTLAGAQSITPANTAANIPALPIAWTTVLTDRADALQVANGAITVFTHDGTRTMLDATGKAQPPEPVDAATVAALPPPAPAAPELSAQAALPTRLLRAVLPGGPGHAALYVGGLVRLFDAQGAVLAERQFSDDVRHGAWLGQRLILALSDGRIVALQP